MVTLILSSAAYGAKTQWAVSEGGNGHWYEAVSHGAKLSWSQAKVLSEAAGGHLVTIANSNENAFVFSLISEPKFWWGTGVGIGPWIGARLSGGSWTWINNESWEWAHWASN